MFQYGPKLPTTPVAPFVRQQAGHSATLPLSVFDVNDVDNVADPLNAGNVEFVKNFNHAADFSAANPRNVNSPEYGAFPGGPTYNTYLI